MSSLWIVLGCAFLLQLALSLLWLFLACLPPRKARTRATQRGGYVKPPASPITKVVVTLDPPAPGTTVYTSSRSGLGSPWVGGVTLAERLGTSRLTEPGSSGNETGEVGASGQQRGSAG